MAEKLQKQIQTEMDNFKSVQKDLQKQLTSRQQLDSKLNENKLVKKELDLLEDGANVYKMMGPVLTKQDLVEAKQNVAKRIDYISAEMKRYENTITETEKKQDGLRDLLLDLQQKYQAMQPKQR